MRLKKDPIDEADTEESPPPVEEAEVEEDPGEVAEVRCWRLRKSACPDAGSDETCVFS